MKIKNMYFSRDVNCLQDAVSHNIVIVFKQIMNNNYM